MQTRSKSGIHKPKQIFTLISQANEHVTPTNYKQASKHDHWKEAMRTEFNALINQNTWTLVPLPPNKRTLGCRWTYKIKLLPSGQIDRYKPRLVALGYDQQFGETYTETFSPVAKMTTFRMLLKLAVNRQWNILQLDVTNVFLHGDLPDDIYMRQPQGFEDLHHPNHVCKLNKSLYGLKQAPRLWFQKFTNFLLTRGFRFSRSDSSLLIYSKHNIQIFFLIYVDDILVTGNNQDSIRHLLRDLHTEFALKQLGNISLFFGIQVTQTQNGYFLTQEHYANKIIHDAGFDQCKNSQTPLALASSNRELNSPPFHDPSLYRRLAGSLQYLTITRPDITFATNQVCQRMHNPTDQDFKSLKRILWYIKGTKHFGLPIQPGDYQLQTYSNAYWASDTTDRKSITGHCTFMGPNLISWSVEKQITVAKSSTEAEYHALSAATSEAIWLCRLSAELQLPQASPTIIHCDNISAIAITKNSVFHARTKHIEIDYQFIREHITDGNIHIQHISSQEQVADIFTKPFSCTRYNYLRSKLTICTPDY
ncbi:Retrovirus-related Pol polyprotein from transposon TNT 1-94 [Dendrobium catenatum]|uniref:Retrovirus-related Pol polyprotein from transposon TNT 1-94 n=1 Tax=Dendrobium catenatum TaxID=906689 RepID=A0A2I0WLK5_9ASPA|nr:Retrovirus-related Pol polyprotein from transposon TNT 1-94 [Dendrobium catenatum]